VFRRLAPRLWWVLAWLVPLLGIWAALAAGSAALATRRTPDATTVVGEIIAGRRIGQTFVTTALGLAGIDLYTATYARPNSGTLVLHVRRSPNLPADLATARLDIAGLPDNDWATFAFPPLALPAGTPLYFEMEAPQSALGNAPTVYWYNGPGDPYGSGQAVLDGQPQPGDLAFGLHYQAPPRALWGQAVATIAARLPTRPAWSLPAASLLLLVMLAMLLADITHGPLQIPRFRIPHSALRTSLVLGIALLHGWLWLWLVPPWQGPDEPQHYAATALLAHQPVTAILTGGVVTPAAASDLEPAILGAMDRYGFTRTVSWYGEKGGPAAHFLDRPAFGGSSLYVQTRQPSLYYRLGAVALRLVAGDGIARLDPDVGLYLVRLLSLGLHLLIVALGWLAAGLLTPGRREAGLRLALPLGLTLWPMPVFIDTVANNDVLAAVAVGATLVAALAWLRSAEWRGRRGGAWGWGVITLALALGSLLTKSTAVPTLLIFALAALIMIGRWARIAWAGWGRRGQGVWIGLGLLVVGGLGLLGLGGLDWQHTAWGWSYSPGVYADRRPAADAHTGGWVLAPAAGRPITQRADFPAAHPALRLDATIWVRAAAPGPVQLALQVDNQTVSSTTLTLAGGPAWTPITTTTMTPAGSLFATVVLFSPGGLEADDASLQATALAQAPGVIPTGNLLGNPSAEGAAISLTPPLQRLLAALPGLNADQFAAALLNPLPFDAGAAIREDLDLQWRSSVGLFGWLAVPLPGGWYTLWGGLLLLVLPGLLLAWPRLHRLDRAWLGMGLAALGAAGVFGLSKVLAQWALFGLRDAPQGRYLFVLLIPLLWLLLVGGRGWLRIAEWGMRIAESRGRGWGTALGAALPRVGLWAWVTLLIVFAAWALLAVVVPYYYGG
jgi:hypothetical protein